MSRVWMRIYLTLIGCPLSVKGEDHFLPGEAYIVIFNHNAFLDIVVSSPFTPGSNKTIAKIELSRIPLFGLLYKTGSVLVDRKSETSRRESLSKMKEVLNMGIHMVIYPEGTRNRGHEPLKNFHDGAFRLAIDTNKKIIPALIFNTRKAMPADKTFFLLPYKIKMHFLMPVEILKDDTVQSLKEKTFVMMRDYYISHQK